MGNGDDNNGGGVPSNFHLGYLTSIPDTRGQFTSQKSSYVGATGDILRLGTFLLLTSSSLVTSQVSQPRVPAGQEVLSQLLGSQLSPFSRPDCRYQSMWPGHLLQPPWIESFIK